MIAIVDYGMGNLRSVQKALEHLGAEAVMTRDAQEIRRASHVILPGVGAFGDAMRYIRKYDLYGVLRETAEGKRPLLGICLGMQLFFESSVEMGEHEGLKLLPGRVVPLQDAPKVPHMGWNDLQIRDTEMFEGLSGETYVYFVHSYCYADTGSGHAAAVTEFGRPFVSAVRRDNIWGMQYHPEKSGAVGMQMLRNFLNYKGDVTC